MLDILFVEDDEEDYLLTCDLLGEVLDEAFVVHRVVSYDAAKKALTASEYGVCLLDYRLGAHDGLDLLREIAAQNCQTPVIVLTGQGSQTVDRAVMGAGAVDYLVKQHVEAPALGRAIRYALARKQAERERIEMIEARAARAHAEAARSLVGEVLWSATEGKLRLCDGAADLPAPLGWVGEPVVLSPASLRALRHQVQSVAAACRYSDERWFDFVAAVGEAAMNTVVHAGHGQARIGANVEGTIQVWIMDQGTGIPLERLHRATLERGYTTVGSMGHGFWMILKMADRIWLHTGPSGTTVVLEQDPTPPEPLWFATETLTSQANL